MRKMLLWVPVLVAGCEFLPGGGGSECSGGYECPALEEIPEGRFEAEAEDGVDDAVVDIAGDEVVIGYTDDDGNAWEVVYQVVGRFPDDG